MNRDVNDRIHRQIITQGMAGAQACDPAVESKETCEWFRAMLYEGEMQDCSETMKRYVLAGCAIVAVFVPARGADTFDFAESSASLKRHLYRRSEK